MVVHPHRAFPHLSDDLVVTVALPLLRIMVSNTWTIRWKIKHTLNDETPSLDTVSWGTQNTSLNRWTVSQLPGTCPRVHGVTCNGTRYLSIRTHDELGTALDPNVVGDGDEDGVALKGK